MEYSEICAAVYKLSGSIFTFEDVTEFLSSLDVGKDNAKRFICWLISFGLLSVYHGKWEDDLYRLYERYWETVRARIADQEDPTKDLKAASATVIQCDLMRGIHWFRMLAGELALSEFYTHDAELRATRVLAALSLSVDGFSYCQGYDRYVFLTYLLALDCCSQTGLKPQFAEALTFFLADRFIKMTHIAHYLENPALTEQHFERMDKVMARVAPETMRLLQDVQQGSIHFALRWELLLFADEYDVRPLLLLWDHVLLRKDTYDRYLFGLCVAHVKQVPVAGPDEMMIEKIQQFKNWDIQKILVDAPRYAEMDKPSIWRHIDKNKVRLAILLSLLALVVILNLIQGLFD